MIALPKLPGVAARTFAALACLAAASAGDPAARAADVRDPAELFRVVDCQLPPRFVQMGRHMRVPEPPRAARVTVGECEARGGKYAVDRADYATSWLIWLPVAQSGDPQAQHYLGELAEKGAFGGPDYARAAEWYGKAADQDFAASQIALANLYEQGLGVERDEGLAVSWYQRAFGVAGTDLIDVAVFDGGQNSLAARYARQTEEIAARDAELAERDETVATLERELAVLESGIADRESALRESEEASARARAEIDAAREAIAAEQAALAEQKAEIAESQSTVATDDAARAALEAEVAALRAELDSRAEELATRSSQLQGRADALAAEQSDLTSSQSELDTRAAALEAREQAVADAVAALDAARSGDEAAVAAHMRDLEAERAAIQAERDELAAGRSDLALSQSELETRASALAAREQAVADAVAALDAERSGDEAEAGELRRKLEQERDAISSERGELASARAALDADRAALDVDRTALAEARAALDAEVARRAAETDTLTLREEELAALEARLKRRKERLAVREEAVAERERTLREQETRTASNERQLSTDSGEPEELHGVLADMRAELAALEQRTAKFLDFLDEPPQIEMIDPPIGQTREAVVDTPQGAAVRTIMGRVGAPRGLSSLTVNGRDIEVDADSVFYAEVPIGADLTRVDITARDEQGEEDTLFFFLEPKDPSRIAADGVRRSASMDIEFGDYHALLIGNQNYQHLNPLRTPHNDVNEIARILRERYGFQTTVLLDATRVETLTAINELRATLNQNDNLLIYYAGHGEL
ncbi:MAG: caspase family protein, partial [Caulobacterales bacterium]|nr:caspase family protein [Caulobacterales bacterium]